MNLSALIIINIFNKLEIVDFLKIETSTIITEIDKNIYIHRLQEIRQCFHVIYILFYST